ncbi:hypothetical protein CLOP_g16215 [Closterium sp. NIES-67]|nr:hypothetical protein CLOP_g16215 [Closterium sp. NIES-67]
MEKDMHEVSNLITDGEGGAKVVAGRKAPTVIAQTERRDRKVVAAVKALASQPSQRGFVAEGMSVTWTRLQYSVPSTNSKWCCLRAEDDATIYRKKVMMNVTGGVAPGNLLAVMGPEGSGKSLLLHMLAGRLQDDPNFRGSIEFSGKPFGATLRREIGFVENDVDLQANLTVKETLMFAAMLRLPEGTEEIDQIVRVEHVLDSLELTHCADKVIGRTGRNAVLYNELRRLAIGVQMIVNPPLLLLDEPTSGLDGAMALRITRALHSYALAGRSVVATMKQPSAKMFSLFTHLLLITDGNPIFFGAAGAALPYFDSIGYTMGADTSAAEFFLDLTAPEAADASIHFGTSTNLIRLWATGDAAREIERAAMPSTAATVSQASAKSGEGGEGQGNGDVEVGEGVGEGTRVRDVDASMDWRGVSGGGGGGIGGGGRGGGGSGKRWVTSWGLQFRVLAQRHLLSYRVVNQDWIFVAVVAVSLLVCTLLPGCLWCKHDPTTAMCIRGMAGLIFFSHFFWGIIPMLTSLSHSHPSKFHPPSNRLPHVIPGCLWYKRDPTTAEGIRDMAGLIFFSQFFWGLIPMLTSVITFLEDRKSVQKEQEDGVYHISAYYAARTLLSLPYEILPPVFYSCIVYWMTGLNPSGGRFVLFTLVLVLDTMVASSIGMAVGTATSTVKQAISIAAILQLLSVMVVHFLSLNPPAWVGWTQYLSFSTYVNKLLMRINFDSAESFTGNCSASNTSSSTAANTCSCAATLELSGLRNPLPGSGWLEACILVAMLIFFRLLALLIVKLRLQSWRWHRNGRT